MRIEVAVPDGATNKEKGDLLESLSIELTRKQSYDVENELRVTGSELDLLCKHKVSGRVLYVECKAHRATLSANELTKLLGTVTFNDYDEGFFAMCFAQGTNAESRKKFFWIEHVGQAFPQPRFSRDCQKTAAWIFVARDSADGGERATSTAVAARINCTVCCGASQCGK